MELDDNGDLASINKKERETILELHSINAFEKLGDQNEHDT